MIITSKDNDSIKHIKKLKEKKYRDEYNEYIVEGIKLINEAILEKIEIKTIVVCDDCVKTGEIDSKSLYEIAKYNCIYVNEPVFKTITDVQNPQGILAVIEKKTCEKATKFNEDVIVILDDIQDPGNLGTILRTVDSVGLKQIVISSTSADIFNSKVIRSTMGAIFRLNIVESDNLGNILKELKKHKYKIFATALGTDKSIYDVEYKKVGIIIGNEANGISKPLLDLSDEIIKIPMLGKTESLNASVATGVVLYEYVRQKLDK